MWYHCAVLLTHACRAVLNAAMGLTAGEEDDCMTTSANEKPLATLAKLFVRSQEEACAMQLGEATVCRGLCCALHGPWRAQRMHMKQ